MLPLLTCLECNSAIMTAFSALPAVRSSNQAISAVLAAMMVFWIRETWGRERGADQGRVIHRESMPPRAPERVVRSRNRCFVSGRHATHLNVAEDDGTRLQVALHAARESGGLGLVESGNQLLEGRM